jgi:hypothetical protein
VCERSVTGPLLYGVRKGYILKSPLSIQRYLSVREILEASGGREAAISKMDEIIKAFSSTVEKKRLILFLEQIVNY